MKFISRLAIAAVAITMLAPSASALRLYKTFGGSYGPTTMGYAGDQFWHATTGELNDPSYLPAGGTSANQLLGLLVNAFPTWGFGIGSPHTGVIHLDKYACGVDGDQSAMTQGFVNWARYRGSRDTEPYAPQRPIWEPVPGVDGSVTYGSNELRWIQMLVPPDAPARINYSAYNTDPAPFYWSAGQDATYTNGTTLVGISPSFWVPYIKQISFGILRPLKPANTPIFPVMRNTWVDTFLVRYQVIGGQPVVTILDGFRTGMKTST